MAKELKFEKEESGGMVTLHLSGSLDVFSYIDLKKKMEEITGAGKVEKLLVDMANLNFVASSGWALFMAQSRAVKRLGGRLVIYAMQDSVQRVYATMRAEAFLASAPSREAALASLEAKI